jgi:hypothetical protein
LSVWELRELRRTLSAGGAAPIDEAAIFASESEYVNDTPTVGGDDCS